jgi:hypothetical protein
VSTFHFLLEGATCALPEQRQLKFAHGALKSEK